MSKWPKLSGKSEDTAAISWMRKGGDALGHETHGRRIEREHVELKHAVEVLQRDVKSLLKMKNNPKPKLYAEQTLDERTGEENIVTTTFQTSASCNNRA